VWELGKVSQQTTKVGQDRSNNQLGQSNTAAADNASLADSLMVC